MSALNESQRDEIVGLYKNNVPNHKIAKIVDVHKKTVTRTIQKCIDEKDLVTKNRSGHPKLIDVENKKILKKIVKQDNRKSAKKIKNKFNEKTSINVSTKTIRRALHELNIFSLCMFWKWSILVILFCQESLVRDFIFSIISLIKMIKM